MNIFFNSVIIIISSVAIYLSGERFAKSSSFIGDFLKLPRDIKGATFDAIASSLPELLVALYSVMIFKQFEVGIGTIAGSALFNLLIIPSVCILVSPVIFKVGKKVINRDAIFYLVSVIILLILLIFFKFWGFIISIVLLSTYLIYILTMIQHKKQSNKKIKLKKIITNKSNKNAKQELWKEISLFILMMIIIGIFTFFLTKSAIEIANILKISPVIIAFVVIAAATSIPDTIISVVNAKKGYIDDATSNVFGSNTFDILVGIGLPLLIYSFFKGSVEIIFSNIEIIVGLLVSTLLVTFLFKKKYSLGKKDAILLLSIYFLFLLYIIYLVIK